MLFKVCIFSLIKDIEIEPSLYEQISRSLETNFILNYRDSIFSHSFYQIKVKIIDTCNISLSHVFQPSCIQPVLISNKHMRPVEKPTVSRWSLVEMHLMVPFWYKIGLITYRLFRMNIFQITGWSKACSQFISKRFFSQINKS